jgi:hypothetical protein
VSSERLHVEPLALPIGQEDSKSVLEHNDRQWVYCSIDALLKTQSQTSPASGSLVGTLLALSLTAAAVA